MRNIIIGIFSLLPVCVFSQLKVMPGTTVNIGAGTTVQMDLHSQQFVIDSAAQVVNNGTIVLSNSTDISEFPLFPITGQGVEITSRDLSGAIAGINIGGLGLQFNNSIGGLTTIIRGHKALMAAPASVKRWFGVTSTAGPLTAGNMVNIQSDYTELNGNNAADLRVAFTQDTTIAWIPLGGTPEPANFKTSAPTDSLGYYTAVSTGLSIFSVNDTSLCLGDSLLVDFITSGLYGPTNQFIFQLSDENGLYASPVIQDTLLSDNIDFNEYLMPTLPGSSDYRFRIMSTVPALVVDSGIAIHTLPVITISGLQPQYCSNLSSSPVTTLPAGGTYNVSFMDTDSIHPSAAPTGPVNFTYSYTDANGCSAALTASTEILAAPVISITGLQTQYCSNVSASTVTTLPVGGSYDVSFIDNDSIYPSAAPIGPVNFTYSYTDANGCFAALTSSTEILTIPVIGITGLQSQYCSNLSSSPVTTLPLGGTYDVGYMDNDSIYPSAAPTVVVTFTYSYTDANGCSAALTSSTEIISAPAIPVITIVHDTLFSSASSGNQWYFNGSLLSGETNPYLLPVGNGTYEVEVSTGGLCNVLSDSLVYFITTVSTERNNVFFTLYPNPATGGFFNIHFPTVTDEAQLSIISNIGQIVKTIYIIKGTNQQIVPIHDLPTGTYLTRLTIDGQHYSTPLVIVK